MATNSYRLKNLISGYYDQQDQRIRVGNRIAALEYQRRMIEAGNVDENGNPIAMKEPDRDPGEHAKMLKAMIDFYKENCEEVNKKNNPGKIKLLEKKNGLIKDILIWSHVEDLVNYTNREAHYANLVNAEVEKHPVYIHFLSKVPYCGTMMSAICLSSFDITKARHVSSFWKYAGLDTVVDPETGERVGRTNKKSLMEEVEYVDSNGEIQKRKTLGYNPKLKSKLLGVLADMFLKYNVYYRSFYDTYRRRLEIRKSMGEDLSPARIHRMAIRYMMKIFVQDLWVNWREIEGYPVEPSYFEVYLAGRPHGENYKPGDVGPDMSKYPGRVYDPTPEDISETQKLTAMHMHDLHAISDEQVEAITGIPADKLKDLNYQKVADFYNRKGEHQKFKKELIQDYLDRTVGKVLTTSSEEKKINKKTKKKS